MARGDKTSPISAESIAYYESVYQSAAPDELKIRSDFDVYMEGDALTCLRVCLIIWFTPPAASA